MYKYVCPSSITAARAVDFEFVYIVEPVVLSLVAFGSTLGSLWLAQAPLGAFGPPPDHHLGPMWVPLALPWAPLAILGLSGRFGLDLESTCKVKVAQVPHLRTKYCFWEFATGETGVTAETEVVQKWWLRPHLPHAPGARMTVV